MNQKRAFVLLAAVLTPFLFGALAAVESSHSPIGAVGQPSPAGGAGDSGGLSTLTWLLSGHVGDDGSQDGADRIAASVSADNGSEDDVAWSPPDGGMLTDGWSLGPILNSYIRGGTAASYGQGTLLTTGLANGPVGFDRGGPVLGGSSGGGRGAGGPAGGGNDRYGTPDPAPAPVLFAYESDPLSPAIAADPDVRPTPLPAALPLLATGLLGLGWVGRGNRRA